MKPPREVGHEIAAGVASTRDDCPTKKRHGWLCDAITATIEDRDREAAAGMVKRGDVIRWLRHCGFGASILMSFDRNFPGDAATTAKEGT